MMHTTDHQALQSTASPYLCLAVQDVPMNVHLRSCEGVNMVLKRKPDQLVWVLAQGSEISWEDEASMKGKGAAVHGVARHWVYLAKIEQDRARVHV